MTSTPSPNADANALVDQAERDGQLSPPAAAQIRRWLGEPAFEGYRAKLVEDIDAGRWKILDDAFYKVLEFGTGGRRGPMYPVGTNVLNDRTIGESARGLADYINARKGEGTPRSCAIACDARHNSSAFAERCARVLAAAGFKVFLFSEPRSTPELSFAVRHLGCDAGIMITASHNPPADNGFKCYDATGGQVVPPDDAGIIACVQAASDRLIPETPMAEGLAAGTIVHVGPELDEAYLAAVVGESVSAARDLSIVFTPLHGVGDSAAGAALRRAGFDRVNVLAAQRTLDGDFPNVPGHVSNPEFPKVLEAAIVEARATRADLVLASDPDADRIGVAVPTTGDPAGTWTALSGNQIGALLVGFVIRQTKAAGRLSPEDYIVTTLVTGQMGRALAERSGVKVEDDLLVGFKWIAQRIDKAGPSGFLFGYEESHGYQKGTFVRDKDSGTASLLVAELAATLKAEGRTVLEYLDELYAAVGHFDERQLTKTLAGREGAAQIQRIMAAFRAEQPAEVAGLPVVAIRDYQEHQIIRPGSTALPEPLPEPSGDLLIYELGAPGTRFAARPSGTEPKIKFYLFARTDVPDPAGLSAAKAATAARLDRMAADLEAFVTAIAG